MGMVQRRQMQFASAEMQDEGMLHVLTLLLLVVIGDEVAPFVVPVVLALFSKTWSRMLKEMDVVALDRASVW